MSEANITPAERPAILPLKNYLIQVRFNQEHALTPGLYWRIFIDGVEHKARSIKILSPMETEEFERDGEMKGNVFTRGYPEFDAHYNVVVHKIDI